VQPKVSFFFNDPSGALRYELWAAVNYDRRLGNGLYLNSDLKLTALETVSGVTQPSNSLLPHVRTDVADYKRGGRFKLNRLMLNKYMMPSERVYARLSGGLYEEMYRGIGGQMLYLPKDSRWAADVNVDALQQRGFKGWLDKRDYQTVSGFASLHYKLPYDVTATARAGRFLAKDNGVRFEFKRRFPSGMEIGAWYAKTSGKDITSPGTPTNPYNDKGVFLSVPLNIMLPFDSQNTASVALSPWTRDVGQMVASPGDLYDMVEQPRRDMTTFDGLGNFAERRDEQNLPAVNPPVSAMPNLWPMFRMRVEQSFNTGPTPPDWAKGAAVGGGAILASALLDKPVDRFMKKHQGSSVARAWDNVGKATPLVFTGIAAGAVAFGDARVQNIGIISLESVASAAALSITAKHIAGRARPDQETGQWSKATDRSNASFPSNHATVAFAAVTPFAQEYDAPWLYGVAAAGSLGRTAGRQHWVSDVVAGSLLGMAVGGWLWQAQRTDTHSSFAVAPGPKSVGVAWFGNY
jgi:membrane-associated phospholipid phosphatase